MLNSLTKSDFKSLEMTVQRIFEESRQENTYLNSFQLWKAKVSQHFDYMKTPSEQALKIIQQSQDKVPLLPNAFEHGLAVTIDLHLPYKEHWSLIADHYQAPIFKIIHILRQSLLRHAKVAAVGCFEVDKNDFLHVHFILDGQRLRNLSEKEVYAFHRAIKLITYRILPRRGASDKGLHKDVLVKGVRDIGFFEYLLKTVKDAKTSEGFFINLIPRSECYWHRSICI